MQQAEGMKVKIASSRLELVIGGITLQGTDVIVNAANTQLAGGGGVDGAIHRSGGPDIMAETRRKYPEGCPTGEAVISGAGDLLARYVVHTAGPVWAAGSATRKICWPALIETVWNGSPRTAVAVWPFLPFRPGLIATPWIWPPGAPSPPLLPF